MIITTTPTVEGFPVKQYLGIVTGEVVEGINFVRDFAAGLTNFFGGRSGSYEDEIMEAREEALNEMEKYAASLSADAIVGVKLDYEVINGSMLFITASGTAVKL